MLKYVNFLPFPLSNSVESKRKQTRHIIFPDCPLPLQGFLYDNTLNMVVMQFGKGRSYFDVLGEQ